MTRSVHKKTKALDVLCRGVLPIVGLPLTVAWLYFVPLTDSPVWFDLAYEGTLLAAAAVGYAFILRLHIRSLAFGWGALTLGLLVDVLDEFTVGSEVDTYLQTVLATSGYVTVAVGLYFSQRMLRNELDRSQRTGAALRESEERFRTLFEQAPVPYHEIDTAGIVRRVNQAECNLLGYEPSEILGKHIWEFVSPKERETSRNAIHRKVSEKQPFTPFQREYLLRDGTLRTLEIHDNLIRNQEGAVVGIRTAMLDITERKAAAQKLLHDATHDALTGLPNRALFTERLKRAVLRAKRRRDALFAVLFLDLDGFKMVNDSLGHSVGDELLIEIGKRLQPCVRAHDTVARVGGDEFTILLEEIDEPADATRVAERVQQKLRMSLALNGQEMFTTASIGIALSTTPHERVEDFLRNADIAMYRAKAQGKARHEVFHIGMHAEAVARLQLETELRRAIEHQEFRVYYQPIVSLEDDKICGCEALVRWQHPQRGIISPAEFLPIAEETGMIVAIDQWVLREACAQNKTWQTAGFPPMRISVNLSANDLKHPHLIETIKRILVETGLEARWLALELTESALMTDPQAAITTLVKIYEMGISVSLDDFGTGYSSLSYLKLFSINTLKIDRSFVRDVTVSPDDAAIVSAVISLAHNLKRKVTAEGVETEDQMAFLRASNCDEVQGFLLGRPLPAEGVSQLLEQPRSISSGRPAIQHAKSTNDQPDVGTITSPPLRSVEEEISR